MTATTSVGGPARTLTANQARQQATRCELDQIEAALRALRRQRVPIAYPPSPATPGYPGPSSIEPRGRDMMTAALTAADGGRRRAGGRHDEQAEAALRQRAQRPGRPEGRPR